jgi:DNA-binding response OmpR family regulator
LAAGVIGYLSKPFEEDDLLACIRSALTHARSGGR